MDTRRCSSCSPASRWSTSSSRRSSCRRPRGKRWKKSRLISRGNEPFSRVCCLRGFLGDECASYLYCTSCVGDHGHAGNDMQVFGRRDGESTPRGGGYRVSREEGARCTRASSASPPFASV